MTHPAQSAAALAAPRAPGWLVRIKPCERAALRLICFPFGGGGPSAFWPWKRALPEGIELFAVSLPGRENRAGEPFATDAAAVVAALCAALGALGETLGDVPFAFYGHSLGAGLAVQTAEALRAAGRPQPRLLIVSGRLPPHHPYSGAWSTRSDAELIARVTELGGVPPEVLHGTAFRGTFLPRIRADFALNESLAYRRIPPFGFPLAVVNGTGDPVVGGVSAEEWRAYTTGRFAAYALPGEHFFFQAQFGALMRIVAHELGSVAGPERPEPPPANAGA